MADTTYDAPASPSMDKVDRGARSLKEALRDAREQYADRNDTVFDSRAADLAQLEALAEEIEPLVKEIDPADDRFEFMLGRGERPRFWIDMITFVAMGQDRETFRLLKDTRMGRLVLSETTSLQTMGDEIASYVAERVIERERMIEGDWHNTKRAALQESQAQAVNKSAPAQRKIAPIEAQSETGAPSKKRRGIFRHLAVFLSGIALAVGAAALAAWAFLPAIFQQASEWFTQLIGSFGAS